MLVNKNENKMRGTSRPVLHLNGCSKKLCPEAALMLAHRISGEIFPDVDDDDIKEILDSHIAQLSEGLE